MPLSWVGEYVTFSCTPLAVRVVVPFAFTITAQTQTTPSMSAYTPASCTLYKPHSANQMRQPEILQNASFIIHIKFKSDIVKANMVKKTKQC